MGQQNGHPYVDNMARDILQAATLRAVMDLFGAEAEMGQHPLKPSSQRFAVTIGGVVAEQEETRFKISNHPEGEIAISAAFLAVCFRRALTIATQVDITRRLAPWLQHMATCGAREATRHTQDFGACTCRLTSLLAKVEGQARAAAGASELPAEGSVGKDES